MARASTIRGSTNTRTASVAPIGGPPGADYDPIREALGVLAAACDYATTLDGQGFNATDTYLGHLLAAMPTDRWTADQALTAWDMLRKYRGQLARYGIDYDTLLRPPSTGEFTDQQRRDSRARCLQGARNWRRQQHRRQQSYVRCEGEGENVTLAFPYDPALVDQAKAIKGRHFDWDTKTNVYPFIRLPEIVSFADAHCIAVAPEVRALVPAATIQAQEEAARPDVHTDRAGRLVIKTEYNLALNQALKALNGGRSTWDARARLHRPPIHRDPGRILAISDEFRLAIGDDARAAIQAEIDRQERNRSAATAFTAPTLDVPGLAPGAALKSQQYPVVRFALDNRRILVGDEMGWGKTLSSLAAVAADRAHPAVVVCRPSLTLNWAAEIRRFFPALTVHQATGTTPETVPVDTGVVVIGSAALAAKPKRNFGTSGTTFPWVEEIAAVAPRALILDEGQDAKERAANRSQACEQLAAMVIARDGLVLDLTGTAILNRPRELCQQLAILGRLAEFGGPKAFLWRYCAGETNEWGVSYDGARNLLELHDRLFAWGIMIRRTDDTALGLPPCREHLLHIRAADLDPDTMTRYRDAERNVIAYLAAEARMAAARLGTNADDAAVKAAMRARRAEHLVALNTLRQLAGQAKRRFVLRWARAQVAAGEKVMIAAHHRDEVDAYAAAFGGLRIQGGQPVRKKEADKAAFQELPLEQAPAIAVAISAGGVGHSLTAARIGIQAEQAWTPGDKNQMKKRLHRIGQARPVDYYVTIAENTIDERVWSIVSAKQATLDAVLDGKTDDGADADENSVAAELAWQLAQRGLAPGSDAG